MGAGPCDPSTKVTPRQSLSAYLHTSWRRVLWMAHAMEVSQLRLAVTLVLALALILFGAELFTNSIEWLGRKLGLGQSAVGSVLAALGTALPETAVPVTAILFGHGKASAHEVGIGGILGAPFLLATLGSLVLAISLLLVRRTHSTYQLKVGSQAFSRDMGFFLFAYGVAIAAGCISSPLVHRVVPLMLLGIYGVFLIVTLREKATDTDDGHLHPLYIQNHADNPAVPLVLVQLFLALACIVGGAQLLTSAVEQVATWFTIPAFVLSAILIPLTTELPETLNSVVWIRRNKDGLALGNVTGAMVFQSTLVPALGIWMTPWHLTPEAMLIGCLTLGAAAYIFGMYRWLGTLIPAILLSASMLYWVLPIQALAALWHNRTVYWWGCSIVLLLSVASVRFGLRYRSK